MIQANKAEKETTLPAIDIRNQNFTTEDESLVSKRKPLK
jgi:hypothetical protein